MIRAGRMVHNTAAAAAATGAQRGAWPLPTSATLSQAQPPLHPKPKQRNCQWHAHLSPRVMRMLLSKKDTSKVADLKSLGGFRKEGSSGTPSSGRPCRRHSTGHE